VRVEPLGGDKMNYNNSENSASVITQNKSQQNSTTKDSEWRKDQEKNWQDSYCMCMYVGRCPRHCTCNEMFCSPCEHCELFEPYEMSSVITTGFELYPRFEQQHDTEHRPVRYVVQIENTDQIKTICLCCGGDIDSQKIGFNANDVQSIMGYSKEQLEILQQCHEEKIASKEMYNSMPEPHRFSCNCTECN